MNYGFGTSLARHKALDISLKSYLMSAMIAEAKAKAFLVWEHLNYIFMRSCRSEINTNSLGRSHIMSNVAGAKGVTALISSKRKGSRLGAEDEGKGKN